MARELFLTAFLFCLIDPPAARAADQLKTMLEGKLGKNAVIGTARIAAEGTRVFYVKTQSDTFSVTCTAITEGGWYCIRSAPPSPSTPPPFVCNPSTQRCE